MALRDLGEIVGLRGAETLERRKRFPQQLDQLTRSIKLLASKPGPRLGGVQRGGLAGSEFDKFNAEALELAPKAAASCLRARAAQQRQFQRFNGGLERAGRGAEPAERMLQQRQQGRRLKLFRSRLGGEPGEN